MASVDIAASTIDERDARALASCMTVLPEYGRAAGVDGYYMVVSDSGTEYLVDIETGGCECDDWQYRQPVGGCKHIRRVEFVIGAREIPAWVDTDRVDDQLGLHIDSGVSDDGR